MQRILLSPSAKNRPPQDRRLVPFALGSAEVWHFEHRLVLHRNRHEHCSQRPVVRGRRLPQLNDRGFVSPLLPLVDSSSTHSNASRSFADAKPSGLTCPNQHVRLDREVTLNRHQLTPELPMMGSVQTRTDSHAPGRGQSGAQLIASVWPVLDRTPPRLTPAPNTARLT